MEITIYGNTLLCKLKRGGPGSKDRQNALSSSLQCVYKLKFSVCRLLSLCPDPVTVWIQMSSAYIRCLNLFNRSEVWVRLCKTKTHDFVFSSPVGIRADCTI